MILNYSIFPLFSVLVNLLVKLIHSPSKFSSYLKIPPYLKYGNKHAQIPRTSHLCLFPTLTSLHLFHLHTLQTDSESIHFYLSL